MLQESNDKSIVHEGDIKMKDSSICTPVLLNKVLDEGRKVGIVIIANARLAKRDKSLCRYVDCTVQTTSVLSDKSRQYSHYLTDSVIAIP